MMSTMAQLFVYGHDLDFRTLFTRAAVPQDYANIPPTRFRRKAHWLDAQFSGAQLGDDAGHPRRDARWPPRLGVRPAGLSTDLAALVKAAAAQVLPDAQLTAFEQRAVPGDGARLVTTLTRHPGGATVQVHARIDESFTLVYDAIVTRAGQRRCLPTAVGAGAAIAPVDAETVGRPRRRQGARRRPGRRDARGPPDPALIPAGLTVVAGFR